MGKPCLLPDEFADQVELLEATPPEVLNTPQRYAVYLAGINRRYPEAEQRSFGDIASETNKLFQSVGKDAFTPQKLSRLVKDPTEVLAGIQVDMAERSVPFEAVAQEAETALERVAAAELVPAPATEVQVLSEAPGRAVEAMPLSPTLPEAVAASPTPSMEKSVPVEVSAEREERRPDLLLEANVLHGTLQFVEFLAKETGDEKLSSEMHTVVSKMIGRDYTNPLIAYTEELDKGLKRHSDAVRAVPGKVVDAVQGSAKTVQEAITARAIQDKAALQNAVDPVQQVWQSIAGKSQETTNAIGNLFRAARAAAGAAVEVFKETHREGADELSMMQAMQERLEQRE